MLSGSNDETAKLWDVKSGKLLHTLGGHTQLVNAVAFSPDGLTALTAGDGIKQWDVATAKVRHSFGPADAGAFAFSPRTDIAVSGVSGDALAVWDVATGKRVRTLKGTASVALSRDGTKLLSGDKLGHNGLHLFDITAGEYSE